MTIFTDAKDNTTVLELKKIIEGKQQQCLKIQFEIISVTKNKMVTFIFVFSGILKVPPANQQLFNKENNLMNDNKSLSEYGLTSSTAKAQCPALVGLALRQENGQFEPLEMTPFSLPPDLPDVMKSPEANGQEQSL